MYESRGDSLHIITLNELTKAIEEKLKLDRREARKYAIIVMDLFGFENRITDNILEQNDRQLFYILESQGLLSTQREEVLLPNGRVWRIHFWSLEKPTIRRYSDGKIILKNKNNRYNEYNKYDVYSYLPEDTWSRKIHLT